ncbi:MAG: TlpA family protein disulfide reductase [Solirubrobacteraceae bacterium]|nr:TlpA family protein disulfide reductase [Solirubrobacteraceae bacterium]
MSAPPDRPPWQSRYGWVLAAAVLAVVAIASIRGLGGGDGAGAAGPQPGARLPPFAVPLALGSLEGDANVAREPDSGAAGRVPACSVRGPEVLNVCELAERGPVVLAFLATRGGDCTRTLDRLEAIHRDHPEVQVAAVSIRGDRDDLRRLVAEHGWTFPVGWDRDGALAALYGVAVCPHVTLAYPGGEVRGTVLGEEPEASLAARVERLVAASRRRGWAPGG